MKTRSFLCLAVALSGGLHECSTVDGGQTDSSAQWATFTDTNRHFQFDYPPSWKINPEPFSVAHYREVFVSVNNFGADRFALREQQVSSNTWEFGADTITNQLPAGAVYLDLGWWEGPWPRWGAGIHEMEAADLRALLKSIHEKTTDDFATQGIEFHKWGRTWSFMVCLRAPVTQESRRTGRKILESFHFDGVPAGDPVWAVGEARKHLPPEANPDKFTREGGSSVYYVQARRVGNQVLVKFTKHLEGQSQETWNFRVTETGTVVTTSGNP